jgi:hypothetical protein
MSSSAWSVDASVAVIDGGPIRPLSATRVGAPPQAAIAATLVIAVAAEKVIALVDNERKWGALIISNRAVETFDRPVQGDRLAQNNANSGNPLNGGYQESLLRSSASLDLRQPISWKSRRESPACNTLPPLGSVPPDEVSLA